MSKKKVEQILPGAGLNGGANAEDIARGALEGHAHEETKQALDTHIETPIPPPSFDITRLSPDQLQELKEQLDNIAPRSNRPMGKPIVRLRKYDDKFIVDFQNAFNTWIKDERANMNVETIMIPVKFLGSNEFVNIAWRDFMNADQVPCDVISRRSEPKEIVDGPPVRNRATGQLTESVVRRLKETFVVRLPAGTEPSEIELEARIVNA